MVEQEDDIRLSDDALGFPIRSAFRCARLMDTAPSLRSDRNGRSFAR